MPRIPRLWVTYEISQPAVDSVRCFVDSLQQRHSFFRPRRSHDHSGASRIGRLRSRIRMIRSFALSKSCLHGSTKGKSTLQARPGLLSLHRSRSFSMQLFLTGPPGNLCRSSHKPMPVIIAGRTRSNIRWPFVVVVAGMAYPLAFSRGIAQEGHCASGGTNAFAANLPHGRSLVCDAEQRAKKSAPTDRGAFHKLCWKLLGLLPLFGSSLLVSLLHLLRHYDLLLSFSCSKQSWWDCGKPAIPSLALLLRMSSATVKKNPEYLAPGLVAAAIYCGTPP
jgi:hypothetical protein